MRVSFHPLAIEEMIQAAQFYESRRADLGNHFLLSIETGLKKVEETPLIAPADNKGRRKWRVKKFPYSLIYRVEEEKVFILAVAHGSRKPGFWETRK